MVTRQQGLLANQPYGGWEAVIPKVGRAGVEPATL